MRKALCLLIYIFSVSTASNVLATGGFQSCGGTGIIGSATSVCNALVKAYGPDYIFDKIECIDDSCNCFARSKDSNDSNVSPDYVGGACKIEGAGIPGEGEVGPIEFPVSDVPTQSEPENPEVDSKKSARTQEEIADRSRVESLIQKARVQDDPGVAQLISKLEKNGVKVKNTNHIVGNPAREVDIETANGIIVQVKNLSSAYKIVQQVQNTEVATGQRTVAFIVQQHRKANSIVQEAGKRVQVTNDFDTLLKWLRGK